MKTRNIRDFLKEDCTLEELKYLGILKGDTNLLQGSSVEPLIKLMIDKGVQRLEYSGLGWFLEVIPTFSNSKSKEKLKRGKVDELKNPGNVFTGTNKYLNPYWLPKK